MSYSAGQFPAEYASKLGHLKVIADPHVQALIDQFETPKVAPGLELEGHLGTIDLTTPSDIRFIIAVDGGRAILPNQLRAEKKLAFLSFAALLLKMADLQYLKAHPVIDPRDVSRLMADRVWYQATALPLSGIHLPGQTVKDTIRQVVHDFLTHTQLYSVLAYLVYHQWDPSYDANPATNAGAAHMLCMGTGCSEEFHLPKDSYRF